MPFSNISHGMCDDSVTLIHWAHDAISSHNWSLIFTNLFDTLGSVYADIQFSTALTPRPISLWTSNVLSMSICEHWYRLSPESTDMFATAQSVSSCCAAPLPCTAQRCEKMQKDYPQKLEWNIVFKVSLFQPFQVIANISGHIDFSVNLEMRTPTWHISHPANGTISLSSTMVHSPWIH